METNDFLYFLSAPKACSDCGHRVIDIGARWSRKGAELSSNEDPGNTWPLSQEEQERIGGVASLDEYQCVECGRSHFVSGQ